jgi:antitoxin (DNA-binding transcriptional repressor) of toxin-antitoxin stability system
MAPIPIRLFRTNLREALARAARGEALVITYRGVPVAEVHPVGTLARMLIDRAPVAEADGSP